MMMYHVPHYVRWESSFSEYVPHVRGKSSFSGKKKRKYEIRTQASSAQPEVEKIRRLSSNEEHYRPIRKA
jgi:hypothetical protein